ncbi:response regulator [bacterium]|nr:response regulator [bacterium]
MENKKTVLIIEDEKALLDSYVEVVQSAGYNVVSAIDGYKGLEVLKKSPDVISLILLDLMMPGLDGLEVLRTIKADKEGYGDAPVIILTNMTSDKVIKEAFDFGAVSYLIKSELEYTDLVNEVKKVLGDK